jgi:Meckel syndrome type 1 protein
MAIDPYRVLGLPAGASAAEVKRAYRRLAKANHPDSAGAAALPRFLEIQRAYETLTSATWRPGMRRPSSGAPGSAGEPWRADPTRARSTPGAQPPRGAQPRAGGSGAKSSGGGSASGGASRTAGSRATGNGPATGTGRASAGPRSKPGSGSRTAGAADGAAGGAAPGRRRPPKKATFGSTTYDEARDQSDTTWSGASWYGPSSGEYWRVNPREYADPRKHGPEYLARAAARAAAAAERRARQGSTDTPVGEPGEDGGTGTSGTSGTPGAAASHPRARSATRGGRARTWSGDASAPHPPRPAWTPPADAATGEASAPPGSGAPGSWAGYSLPTSPGSRRLLRAVIAWPPLGIAAAAVIGEATGCAAFEATCTAPADLYPWFAQAAILVVLLVLPAVARILAGGTVAVAVLAFPVAAALSASGASYDRTYGPAALIAVLAVVWVLGVGAVLLRRAVTRGIP